MSTIHVLDSSGDTTLEWEATPELVAEVESAFDVGRVKDAEVAHDIALAKALFDKMKGMGYRAHQTQSPTDTGNDAVIAHKFPEEAAAVIMVPQTVGG